MKHIFFVTKIGELYDRVLPLTEEKKSKGEIIVFVTDDEVEMFLKNYTDLKIIRLNVNPNLITQKTKHKIFLNILKSKKEYKKYFSDIKNSEVYFFGNSFSIVVFSYISKLAKNNKVFHCKTPNKDVTVEYSIDNSFKAYVLRWMAKWALGVETTIYKNQGIPFWRLNQKFFDKNNIEKLTLNYKGGKSFKIELEILDGKEVLITPQNLLVHNYVTRDSYTDTVNKIIDILEKIFPEKYAIKPHPRIKKLHGKMAESKYIIPAYIPSEFLMEKNWKIVIGMFSTSLVSAKKLTDAVVISTVDLYKWNDEEKHMKWIKVMEDAGILIPRDFDEFKKMLNS